MKKTSFTYFMLKDPSSCLTQNSFLAIAIQPAHILKRMK